MTVKTKPKTKKKPPSIDMDICDFCDGPLGTPYAEIRITDPSHVLYGEISRMCKLCCAKFKIPIGVL